VRILHNKDVTLFIGVTAMIDTTMERLHILQ